jgi:hypothetical protein
MFNQEVIDFLKDLTYNEEARRILRTKSKDEVLAFAHNMGFEFPENDFDDTIWGYEQQLAMKLNQNFDLSFKLWETMWGRSYLDYLIDNLISTYDNVVTN